MQVNTTDLTWYPFIYPRGAKKQETVNAYVEALKIGAKFPPIKIQRVFNYNPFPHTPKRNMRNFLKNSFLLAHKNIMAEQ